MIVKVEYCFCSAVLGIASASDCPTYRQCRVATAGRDVYSVNSSSAYLLLFCGSSFIQLLTQLSNG